MAILCSVTLPCLLHERPPLLWIMRFWRLALSPQHYLSLVLHSVSLDWMNERGSMRRVRKGFGLTAHFSIIIIFAFLTALCNKLLLISSSLLSSFCLFCHFTTFKAKVWLLHSGNCTRFHVYKDKKTRHCLQGSVNLWIVAVSYSS